MIHIYYTHTVMVQNGTNATLNCIDRLIGVPFVNRFGHMEEKALEVFHHSMFTFPLLS